MSQVNRERYDPVKHKDTVLLLQGGSKAGYVNKLYVPKSAISRYTSHGWKTEKEFLRIENNRRRQGKTWCGIDAPANTPDPATEGILPQGQRYHTHNGELVIIDDRDQSVTNIAEFYKTELDGEG